MSIDKLNDLAIADFQILETNSFNNDFSQGLEFHLNLQCPTCECFKNKFVCCDCVRSELFITNPVLNKTGDISTSNRLVEIRNLIKDVSQSRANELNNFISCLKSTVSHFSDLNLEKRRRQHRLRQAMTRCHTASQQLSKRQALLMRHFLTLAQRRKVLIFNLTTTNKQIKRMHDIVLEELFGVHFVTELSADIVLPDKFVGSSLHIDKIKIFAGPEPTPSSHTALTYCSIAIRVATILLDVWLPAFIRRNLHLSGSFLSVLPQRDDMGRVYSAIIHAVHLLCISRDIDVRSGLKQLGVDMWTGQSAYNPLLGLYCLAHLVNDNNKTDCSFDDPYKLELNGLFGTVPLLNPNSSCHRAFPISLLIEQGEEALDTLSLQKDDQSLDSQPSSIQLESNLTRLSSVRSESEHIPALNAPDWEWVSFDPVNLKSNEIVQTIDGSNNALSTVWKLATGFMRSSSPPIDDES